MTNSVKNFISAYTPYLEEMRKKLIFLFVLFCIIFVAGFFLSGFLIRFFLDIFRIENVQVMVTSPFQFVGLAMNIGFFLAIMVALPLCVYGIFSFLKPALTQREKAKSILAIIASAFLFCIGSLFGFSVMYNALKIIAGFNFTLGISNLWDITQFSSQVMLTAVLMGVIFQFPIILTVLIRCGIINRDDLRRKRRWVVLTAFILSALLPPTDGLSLLVMSLPIIFLFEITLLINRKHKPHQVEAYA